MGPTEHFPLCVKVDKRDVLMEAFNSTHRAPKQTGEHVGRTHKHTHTYMKEEGSKKKAFLCSFILSFRD